MKRFIVFLTFFSFVIYVADAQKNLMKVIDEYFKLNPFEKKFSTFLNSLMYDSSLQKDQVIKRTDTSFFYFRGHYKNFNPFHFKVSQTQVVMAETEFVYDDSLQTVDTIILYQIIGITDYNEIQKALVKKEFEHFQKKYGRDFWTRNYEDFKKDKVLAGESNNYFVIMKTISPISVAWGILPEENKCAFTITVRLKVKENYAALPEPPYGF